MNKRLIARAIALIGCAGAAPSILAQAAPIERVIITGSNIKRVEGESASPVQTLTRAEIVDSGAATVADLLRRIPALGSGNRVDARDSGFSKGVATASLRGLGSASTLVLVNGRRIAAGAYADPNSGQSTLYDLNAVPLSAIERVEILKDGASAVYGSDAIAGVINFITRDDVQGAQLMASAGADIHANFGRQRVTATMGSGQLDTDGYNAFMVLDLARRQRASLADAVRVDTAAYAEVTGRLSGYYSAISRYPVFYREARPRAGYNRYAGADLSCDPAAQRTGSTALVPMLPNDPLLGQRFCNYDGWQMEDAEGEGAAHHLMGRMEARPGAQVNAYLEAGYNRSAADYRGPSRWINGRGAATGSPFAPVLGADHPDNPTRATAYPVPVAVSYRFEDARGGSANTNSASRVLAGLRGVLGAWDWDSALLHGQSRRRQVTYGLVHKPTAARLYTENLPLAQVAALPGATRDLVVHAAARVSALDFKASRDLGSLEGGAAALAAGIELRRETLAIVPDTLSDSGEMLGVATQHAQAARRVSSAFVELRTPFTRALALDWAARIDKYEGIRRSITPKAGAKYILSPQAALRATVSRGFRAPALTQHVNGGTQFFLNGFEDRLRCGKRGADPLDCARDIVGVTAPNAHLAPETARSMTAGLVLSPTPSLDLMLDYYQLRKHNEIDLLDAVSVVADPRYAAYVQRDPDPATWLRDANGRPVPGSGPLLGVATPYVNAGGTRTSGIDLEAVLRTSLGEYGRVQTRLNSAYLIGYRKAQNMGDPMVDLAGTNGALAYDLTSVPELPRWKSLLSATWKLARHSTTVSANFVSGVSLLARYSVQQEGEAAPFIGPYPEPFCPYAPAGAQTAYARIDPACQVRHWTTFDLSYQYTWSRQLTVGAHVANLLDERAPFDASNAGGDSHGIAGYNPVLHNGRGRYFTVRMEYRF